MKKYILLLSLMLLCLGTTIHEVHRLEIFVEGFDVMQGNLYVRLHANETQFNSDQGPKEFSKIVSVTSKTVTVRFDSLPNGNYAVKLFHDANQNGVLDKNVLGIPKEKYGFSNNAMRAFGPPAYAEAKFEVRATTTHRIRLR
jgi:uncharacterized protein (DUF2141 family)